VKNSRTRELEKRAYDPIVHRLARFAWLLLAYNIAVILWGAYVRASGSGAGCGSHWPLCNGEVVPRLPSTATLIEYSHRLTSGLALAGVIALLVWTRRLRPAGDAARRAAAASVVFMLTEAAVGAGLVLFRLVADNASMARALFMAAHLTNTFVLLATLALTAWWLSGGSAPAPRERPRVAGAWALSAGAFLVASISGAIAALGDTLYPSASLAEGLSADLSATSHLLIRLRMLHPVLAISAVAVVMLIAPCLVRHDDPTGQQLARLVIALSGLQVVAGLVNVLLLAPIWMQLVHLLLADAVWIALILLGAQALCAGRVAAVKTHAA
jgi:cytochrome c oxidase assembly protein subunit 15